MTFEYVLFDVDLPAERIAALGALLDANERERAAAFRFERDRNRFIARRGLLREELARKIGCAADEVAMAISEHGKPYLPDAPHLRFSLSHSAGRGLCAFSVETEIGCDIEELNSTHARLDVAERFFAPDELAALTALPPDQWLQGFYNCWTRKEAYVKALGLGLLYPLNSFAVSLDPAQPPGLLRGEPGCSMSSIDVDSGFCGAVVTLDPWRQSSARSANGTRTGLSAT
jgi:4'-phosphopantetheinyl transferase